MYKENSINKDIIEKEILLEQGTINMEVMMISNNDIVIWRLQTRSGGGHIGEYCLRKRVIAMGWRKSDKVITYNKVFNDFEDYVLWYEGNIGTVGDSVYRLAHDMKKNDLVWMRDGGIYYLGRVTGDWRFCSDKEAVEKDACNQRDVEWIKVGDYSDESSVPGAVNNSMIKGSTLQRIWKKGVKEYSIKCFNHEKKGTYTDVRLDFDCETFFSLLSNDDCEDLLYFYLFKRERFICIPSSDKRSTPAYEYVMIDPKTGEHKYAQVKQQDDDLDASETKYLNIQGDMWFFNGGKGDVRNLGEKQHRITKDELFQFAISEDSSTSMSRSISNWITFLTGLDENGESLNAQDASEVKGVMFDTLGEEYEKDMLRNNKVSAYGRSARYVKSAFRKGDFVFYYSKGKGIIAVGRIMDDEPHKDGDELYREVEIIYPNNSSAAVNPLTAFEIKSLTNHNYYFASTIKSPYLDEIQSQKLLEALRKKNL